MTTRIVMPAENEAGLEASLAEHFGRAPYFAVIDLDENGQVVEVKTEPNRGEHAGGVGHPHEALLDLNPNVIIAFGMGPRGLLSFQNAGVRVLKANAKTVNETIEAFKEGRLEELVGGCEHAHHHTH
jgi:predicted Fe-Mo cluster-binding NifX family protein